MGKSPAKWIKTLLLGKKSSKSSFSKGKEKLKSANKGEVLVSSKVTVSDLSVDPPSISAPILVNSARNVVDSEKGIPAQLPNDGANIPSPKVDGNDATTGNFGNPENPDRIGLDPAAVTVQAAFRGYLARRAFRTLKGIIRLQAVIRGHLVRRQAVATLCCTWGIVKLQALARGQKVRCSDIAMEIQEKHLRLLQLIAHNMLLSWVHFTSLFKQGSKSSDSIGVSTSSKVKNLSNNVFVQKLLASSPSVLPLQLQYVPEEPNSSWQWLLRWTMSHFWVSPLKPVRSGKTKRSIQKLSNAKVVNGSSHSTLEHEKNKRGLRRVSGNSAADSVRKHPQNELERVKRSLRKLSDSSKEVSDKSEVFNEKTKKTLKKTSNSNDPDFSEQESAEKIRDVTATLSELSILEADLKMSLEDPSLGEPNVCPAVDLSPAENNRKLEVIEELISKDEQVGDESSNTSQRRASFPAKIDNQANGLNLMPKVPSYMAATESAKARLRGQGSPMFTPEAVEKNGLNRRYSLPSSTYSNTSSQSPHGQRRVRVAGKGANISDKSQSSSKDANGKHHFTLMPHLKVVRAEWRRTCYPPSPLNIIYGLSSSEFLEGPYTKYFSFTRGKKNLKTAVIRFTGMKMRNDAHWPFCQLPCDMPQLETSWLIHGFVSEIWIAVYLLSNAMGLEKMVPTRVPPNTSVGHQGPPVYLGSGKSRPHNPSEVI
ncbi:hypothetical protein GOBAR_AA05772 [Gossypium barbadense]|uniref:DUF4005 domain-containing protein n=1 Tax=Gossypium barbadense TaxID=3634 RepID=A0A2P5YGY6_GOSBA|nr:hypothetical protein GOBAR_AA05772 [Gossypium barbadense]